LIGLVSVSYSTVECLSFDSESEPLFEARTGFRVSSDDMNVKLSNEWLISFFLRMHVFWNGYC